MQLFSEDCKCFQFHGWIERMINDFKWDFLRLSDESHDKNDDKLVWLPYKLFAHIRCWIRHSCLQKKDDEFLGLLLTVKFRENNNLRNSSFLCKYANISEGPVLLQIKNTHRYLRTYRWLISEWASRSFLLVMNYWVNIKKVCGDLKIPTATENTYYKMFPFSPEVFYPKSLNHALLSYVRISLKLLSYHWHIWQWHQKKQVYSSVSYLVITFHMLSIDIK